MKKKMREKKLKFIKKNMIKTKIVTKKDLDLKNEIKNQSTISL